MCFSNLVVIPAKAGIQGSSVTALSQLSPGQALDPRFPGGGPREGGDSLLRLHIVFPDGRCADRLSNRRR